MQRALLATLIAAMPALPAAAATDTMSPAATKAPKTMQAAVHAAAVREAAVVTAPRARTTGRADQASSTRSTGFFRSGPGAIALAVMAVGTGYAIYSASHDKITSPGKK